MTIDVFYPVAGCGACDHRLASDYHYRWLVVDASGCALGGRAELALQSVSVEIRMGYLVLRAPGMLRMDLPLDVIEDDDSVRRTVSVGAQKVDVVDEGDVAAVWFGHVTDTPCRLVKVHPDADFRP